MSASAVRRIQSGMACSEAGDTNRFSVITSVSCCARGLKPAQIMMAVRALVTGQAQTPAIDAILALLGRDTTRERMKAGLAL